MTQRYKAIALASALTLCRAAGAAPFDPLVVAGDAKFVAFVDLEAGRKTAVGGWIIERIQENPGYQQFEQIMLQLAGFMPASDIHDFTIYGNRFVEEPDASLVIHANFDSVRLANALTMARDFTSDDYRGHSLLSWVDEKDGKRINACIFDTQTIVMNKSVEALKAAVDVLDDPNKAMNEKSELPKPAQQDSWAFAVVSHLDSAPAVLKNELLNGFLDRGSLELGEKDASAVATLTVITRTPLQAQWTRRMMDGAIAAVQLASNQRGATTQEATKLAGELIEKVTTHVEGNNVVATLSLQNDRVKQILTRLQEMKESQGN